MSSFIGHSIAAATVFVSDKRVGRARSEIRWALWLVVVAVAPDIDYAIRSLRVGPAEIRLTHSLVGALVLPVITIALGLNHGWRGLLWKTRVFQVIAAGLSHLVLDLLVGVDPLPLFWPLTLATYKLPFGILPSAPLLSLSNPLLYTNTLIEIGALIPLALCIYWIRRRGVADWRQMAGVGVLACVSALFMIWASRLAR